LSPEVLHIHGDRTQLGKYRDQFQRLAPEVVVDIRAMTEHDALMVRDVFRGVARRLIALGSGDVYHAYDILRGLESGPPQGTPLAEDSALRQKFYPYRGPVPREPEDPMPWADDYDKILVERVVLGEPSLPGTILRLPMVYGPGDGHHRLFPYLKRMDDHRPFILVGEPQARWRWTRGYAENVAAAIAAAAMNEQAAGRIFNIGEPDTLSETEWIKAIGLEAGWKGKVISVPQGQLPGKQPALNFEQDLEVDTSLIRRELGYTEAVSRAEALRRTIAWERAHPPGPIDPEEFDYVAEDRVLAGVSGRYDPVTAPPSGAT
jgi:nucleoside-diphosphate-sugar epimerase